MYSRLQAAISWYSAAYRSYNTLSLTDILVQERGCYRVSIPGERQLGERLLCPKLQTDTLGTVYLHYYYVFLYFMYD